MLNTFRLAQDVNFGFLLLKVLLIVQILPPDHHRLLQTPNATKVTKKAIISQIYNEQGGARIVLPLHQLLAKFATSSKPAGEIPRCYSGFL